MLAANRFQAADDIFLLIPRRNNTESPVFGFSTAEKYSGIDLQLNQ